MNAKTLLPPAPECRVQGIGDRAQDEGPDATGAAVLLACGNGMRQDDGVGLLIAEALEKLVGESRLRIIAVQQWTPELAAELARTGLAIFVDASAEDEPGAIRVKSISVSTPANVRQMRGTQVETHGLEPAELLALAEQVYGDAPARAFVVTVGAEAFHYGEGISGRVRQAVPRAVRLVENLVAAFSPRREPGQA